MQQESLIRERQEDMEWVKKEQDRIKIWNEEEKNKESKIAKQREQQLRELAALRAREKQEMQDYDMGILRSIHKEIKQERAKEAAKRQSDAENLRQVALQNVAHIEHVKQAKQAEIDQMRALEAQWT